MNMGFLWSFLDVWLVVVDLFVLVFFLRKKKEWLLLSVGIMVPIYKKVGYQLDCSPSELGSDPAAAPR